MYKILMQTSAETIQELANDEKWLGAKVGILQILHTWTQKLDYHPHSHMLVTAGGIDEFGKWKEKEGEYLVPVKVLSSVYRGKFIKRLEEKRKELKLREKYQEEKEWKKLIKELREKEFVTYIKEPYENPETVIEYFGRYVYNVGISESRIKGYDGERVRYTYKDRKKGKEKEDIITGEEFIKKMSLHILPKGFRKIRSYGIMSNRNLKKKSAEINNKIKKEKIRKDLEVLKDRINCVRCRKCGSEHVIIIYGVEKEVSKIKRIQLE